MRYSGSLQRAFQVVKPYKEYRIDFLGSIPQDKNILSKYHEVVSFLWDEGVLIIQIIPSCTDIGFIARELVSNGLNVQTIVENKLNLRSYS